VSEPIGRVDGARIWQNRFLDAQLDRVRYPDGTIGEQVLIHHPGAAAIVPFLNDTARGQLQADLERQQRDLQRFTEDAQQDVAALQQQLQEEFQRKLNPIIDRVAKEKQVHMIFSAGDSGLVWADPSLNLTGDVIKAFDSAGPAAARPAAPAAGK